MAVFAQLRELDHQQRSAVLASFLGWTLDAFDFFLLVFVIKDIAGEFGSDVKDVTFAILLTLAMRPLGAFIFGLLADRFGRRPTLMADIILYSVLELASAFAPSLGMETIPPKSRGLVSGILQQGYAVGYLLAAIVYYLLFSLIGWRGMFAV